MYYKDLMNKNGYVEYKSKDPTIFQRIFHYVKQEDETKQIYLVQKHDGKYYFSFPIKSQEMNYVSAKNKLTNGFCLYIEGIICRYLFDDSDVMHKTIAISTQATIEGVKDDPKKKHRRKSKNK